MNAIFCAQEGAIAARGLPADAVVLEVGAGTGVGTAAFLVATSFWRQRRPQAVALRRLRAALRPGGDGSSDCGLGCIGA